MSQGVPPKNGASPADAIAAIGRAGFQATDLTPLSDLGRSDAAVLRRAWPEFPEEHRERAVRQMVELAESDVQYVFGRALRIALDDTSPVVRQLAIAGLWEDERSDLADRLIHLLRSDPSDDVRAEAAQGLERFAELASTGDVDAATGDVLRRALLQTASDPSEPYIVRRRALESVAAFGRQDDIVELIRDAYDADDAGLRAGALYAMGQSLDLGWLDTVIHEFTSPDSEMRFESARAGGHLGEDRAVPGLIDLTRDEDVEVRHAAIMALGKIGGPSAVNALRQLGRSRKSVDTEVIEGALEEALISSDALRARS